MAKKEDWTNKEDVLAAIREVGPHVFLYTYEEFRGDREIVLEAVKEYGGALEYASEVFRGDREFEKRMTPDILQGKSMEQKIDIVQLAPFAPCTVHIRGKVLYSHLTHHIEGEELEKENKRRLSAGQKRIDRPYIAIDVTDAFIVDDGLHPLVKRFFEQELYHKTNKDGTETVYYYGISELTNLPTIVYSKEAGDLAGFGIADNDVPLEYEMAPGLDITIGVSLNMPQDNLGTTVELSITYIFVNEPIKYYIKLGR